MGVGPALSSDPLHEGNTRHGVPRQTYIFPVGRERRRDANAPGQRGASARGSSFPRAPGRTLKHRAPFRIIAGERLG